jgi:hypothetical protein
MPLVVLTFCAAPRLLAPSLNCTVPVGVPAPVEVGLMVAVKVTDCPKMDGLSEEVTAVVVEALFTVWEVVAELVLKLPSPP